MDCHLPSNYLCIIRKNDKNSLETMITIKELQVLEFY